MPVHDSAINHTEPPVVRQPRAHLTRSGREAIVLAGGFDEPLGAAPGRNAHWSSRADWYVREDRLLVQD
jgi:hypothetical protein